MALMASLLLAGCGSSSGGTINTVAGTGGSGFSGDTQPAVDAELRDPTALAADSSGNFYIADSGNNAIREVSSSGVINTVAGSETIGYSGDNGAATQASLNYPAGIAVDKSGNLFIADMGNNVVRKVSGGIITTVAGGGLQSPSKTGISATSAKLNLPTGVAVDSSGNLYIADVGDNVICKVSSGIITTVAGTGTAGFGGDGGPATANIPATSNAPADIAMLNGPRSVAVDSSGNIYIADSGNDVIREVTADGNIMTIAGQTLNGVGVTGDSGDNGLAKDSVLFDPTDVVVDSSGNIYIADLGNNVVREITAADGKIATIAGNTDKGYTGNGGPAAKATLNGPTGVAVDSSGNVYIADSGNEVVREVTH
jgi:sugar lactone lactonase YvrE